MNTNLERAKNAIKIALPGSLKTCIWIVKLTVGVSFGILLLKYFNILPYISNFLEPAFHLVGLPGEAALAYVSGYFVNVYSAIAVAVTLDLDIRAMTILSVMVLCAHNIIIETAVQKKTGTSALRIVILRTFSSIFLGFILNIVMPVSNKVVETSVITTESLAFLPMLKEWGVSTLLLVIKMVTLIFSLNIVQKLLSEFGVIRWLSKFLRPLLAVLGLPAKTSLLWIVANFLGLAYGAAAMLEEVDSGKLSKTDIDLLNTHICICHSNVEDLFLLASVGGIWWILLFSRVIMALILVWLLKLELFIKNKIVSLQVKVN